jgi:Uma2 family endonuclease
MNPWYDVRMGLPQPKNRHSVEDYFRLERDSSVRHEYHEGEILAMAGNSPEHSLIASNLIGELHTRLKGKPCRVYESNLRIRAGKISRYVYPDLSVVCGPLQYDPADAKRETVMNPRVIIEILSPTTEAYDRGEKFDHYRQLASLEEYVLVWQHTPRIDTLTRQPGGTWQLASVTAMDAVVGLQSLGLELPLSEVYADVEFPPDESAEAV